MPIQNVSQNFVGFVDNSGFTEEGTNVILLSGEKPNFGDGSTNNFELGAIAGSLFWDGREKSLEAMVMQPILNHQEMGIRDLEDVVKKVNNIAYYKAGFQQVYWKSEVDLAMISNALASFVQSIKSNNTKFDQSNSGLVKLDALESQGKQLFFEKYDCNSCHQVQSPTGYLFSGGGFANIGLDPVYEDEGLSETTNNTSDAGKFKIPSLRNVELTGPYMHDGRFESLEEVIEHYNTGMSSNENLDFRLRDAQGNPRLMDISKSETRAIIAFLKTLTDYEMISSPAYSDPFTY